jgi:hypothetical protein
MVSGKFKIVYSAVFSHPTVCGKVMEFLSSCAESTNMKILLVGRDSRLVELGNSNVKRVNKVEQVFLPVLYSSCHFGLVL